MKRQPIAEWDAIVISIGRRFQRMASQRHSRQSGGRLGQRRTRAIAAAIGALAASCTFAAAPLFAQDDLEPTPQAWPSPTAQDIAAGKADFMKHCAPCHGSNAQGHGPEVNVIPGIKPADLTKIAMRDGGVFPRRQVADTIDGRKNIPSHKRFDMPFWGVNFQQEGKEFTPESEAKANQRMEAIVDYIETIQR
jgi:mono/diheme cytochrome c family protein